MQTIIVDTYSVNFVPVVEESSSRKTSIATGALTGAAGAGLLAGIMYSLWKTNRGPKPLFLKTDMPKALDHVSGVGRFGIAGAFWGALFGTLVRRPTIGRGMAFGFLPSLFLWTVLARRAGQKPFFGFDTKKIAMPILFNSVIWGSLIGLVSKRRTG